VAHVTVRESATVSGDRENLFLKDSFRQLLIFGFGGLAGYATYDGLYQLIAANTESGKLELPVHLLIIASATFLILMTIYVLRLMRSARRFLGKLGYLLFYLLLAFISVALGFGFYWKWLNSGDVQRGTEQAALLNVQSTFELAATQINNIVSRAAVLRTYSEQKSNEEVTKGFTCDKITGPGAGARRRLRQEDAGLAAEIHTYLTTNTGFIAPDIVALKKMREETARVTNSDEHRKSIDRFNSEMTLMAGRYNSFQSAPQLAVLKDRAERRAQQKDWPDTRGARFTCPDLEFENSLRSVSGSIAALKPLTATPIRSVVGEKATIEAFKRLFNSIIGLMPTASSAAGYLSIPWLGERLRDPPPRMSESPTTARDAAATKLREDDIIPLAIAALVDLCLFVSTRRSRRYGRRIFDDTEGAREFAQDLRKLNKEIRAEDLFNDYVFSRRGKDYIFVPVGVALGMPNDPQRNQRMRDRAMALAFVSLNRPEIGLLRRVWFPRRFFPRSAMVGRGNSYLENHNEFAVYKLAANALQEIISALMLYPDDAPSSSLSSPSSAPGLRGGRSTTTTPGPRPASGTPVSNAPTQQSGREERPPSRSNEREPPAEPPRSAPGPAGPRGKPPGI
jgi:hypothetical protein